MSEEQLDPDINRRGFLKAAALTVVAASAAGSTAGLLLKDKGGASVILPSPIQNAPRPNPIGIEPDVVELRSQLAAAQAENSRLQVRLSAAQSQLDLLQRIDAGQGNSELEAWRLQLDEANVQIASLNDEVSILQGLVNLYEQLDAVDLAAVAGGGVAAVSGLLGELAEEVPSVSEGIQAGQEALAEFEEQLPLLKDGRQWLANRTNLIDQLYQIVERALEQAVQSTGTLLQQLNEWIQDILRWLPFGIGDKAAKILDAITQLLIEIPDTLDGLHQQLALPLDAWLEEQDGELRVQKRLVKPVRDNALGRAAQTIDRVGTFQNDYQTQLAGPVEVATNNHQGIRSQIAEYRKTHNL